MIIPRWLPREPPLRASGVVLRGAPAREVARRLLAAPERLAGLRGVVTDDALVLLGDAERLPWADGAIYLGQDADAPRLRLPTTVRPDVPAGLLERALARAYGEAALPLAVLPYLAVPIGAAGRVDAAVLSAWSAR